MNVPFEDTRANFNCYVVKDAPVDHIRWYNHTGSTVNPGDLIIVGPWVCVVDEEIENHEYGSLCVAGGVLVNVRPGLIADGTTFATFGQEVYFNPTTGHFHDTTDAGRYLVGYLRRVTDADGSFAFEKRRYAVTGIES